MAEPSQAVSCQNDFNIFNVSSVQHLLISNVIAPSNPQNPSKVTLLNGTKLRDVVAVKLVSRFRNHTSPTASDNACTL